MVRAWRDYRGPEGGFSSQPGPRVGSTAKSGALLASAPVTPIVARLSILAAISEGEAIPIRLGRHV